MISDIVQRSIGSRMVSVLSHPGDFRDLRAIMKNDTRGIAIGRSAAVVIVLSVCMSACALHWPWKRGSVTAPQPVHEVIIAADGSRRIEAVPISQYWDRYTLLLDLTAVAGDGGARLMPIAGRGGWPVRLEFRVRPGSFARLEVQASQRVVFSLPTQGALMVLKLAPGVYQSDTAAITLHWTAAGD